MPANVTDHDLWARAKRRAAEEGQGENHAYTNSIYQKMGGTFTHKTQKSDTPFHILVEDNQPATVGSYDDTGLYSVGVEYDRATMTEANGALSKATGIIDGQIPRMSIPSSLTRMPVGGRTAEKLLSFNEPVTSVRGITRGLALNLGQENEIQAEVTANMGMPELNGRTALNQKLAYMRLDNVQRRAISVRASRYYRDHGGFDHNERERLQRRLLGLRQVRKSEEGGLPTEWGVLLAAANPDGSRKKCSNCVMWVVSENACTIHDRDVTTTGQHVCGYHVYGSPMPKWMDHPGIDPVKPKWSGLELVPEGTACDNCTHYAGEDGSGRCLAIEGHPKVTGRMCCARWKRIEERLVMLSKAGPFIGPKGGKWADAAHTIPWKEDLPSKGPKFGKPSVQEIGGALKKAGIPRHQKGAMSRHKRGVAEHGIAVIKIGGWPHVEHSDADPAALKTGVQALLDAGFSVRSPLTRRIIMPGEAPTTEDLQGGILKVAKVAPGDVVEKADLRVDVKEYMPDWRDPKRRWRDVGGDLEASYDGARYVDFRDKTTGERMMFASQGLLENATALFVPAPIAKADPRGGKYHRRVTNNEGKHRYFYSEDDYAKRPDAHVSGRDVLKKKCREGLVKRVGKGCTLDDLKGYGGFDDELIKDAIRDSVRAGELVHANGKLKPAAEKLGATGTSG